MQFAAGGTPQNAHEPSRASSGYLPQFNHAVICAKQNTDPCIHAGNHNALPDEPERRRGRPAT